MITALGSDELTGFGAAIVAALERLGISAEYREELIDEEDGGGVQRGIACRNADLEVARRVMGRVELPLIRCLGLDRLYQGVDRVPIGFLYWAHHLPRLLDHEALELRGDLVGVVTIWSCGPPTPEVKLARSCPTTSRVPPRFRAADA